MKKIRIKPVEETDLEVRIAVLEEKLASAGKELTLAREALNERLQGMNEFRAALTDQAATFITRQEYNILANEIRDLREFKVAVQSKASLSMVYISWLISFFAIIISFFRIA